MAQKGDRQISDAIFYLLALSIILYLTIWSLVNIVGIVGIGLTMWTIIRIYSKFRSGYNFSLSTYKLELIVLIIGLILSVGWFSYTG